MAGPAWNNMPDLGRALKKRFVKLAKMADKNNNITKNVHASNGMCQIVMQIIAIQNSAVTNERLDKIELLLQNIPPQIMQEAVQKVEQQK